MNDIISILWIMALLLPAVYFLIITVASVCHKPHKGVELNKQSRFLIVVPAHNESAVIFDCVRSILDASYPDKCLELWVIADNCTDTTAETARSAGAYVWERVDEKRKSKGAAIQDFLKRYHALLVPAELTVFIDADTIVDPSFFTSIQSAHQEEPFEVAQSYYGVRNPGKNWRTSLFAIALAVVHHLRPMGRTSLGGSAGLKGNGMVFSSDFLKRQGWQANSLVEDLEFSLDLAMQGVRIAYIPDAQVFAEMPETQVNARSQRERWEMGRFEILRKWMLPMLGSMFARPTLLKFDALVDLVFPPLSLLVFFNVVSLMTGWILHPAVSLVSLFALCVYSSSIGIACVQRQLPLVYLGSLIQLPRFLIEKIQIYLMFIFRRERLLKWVKTERNTECREKY